MAETESQGRVPAKSNSKVIFLVAVLAFVGSGLGFAWWEGLFRPPPEPAATATAQPAEPAHADRVSASADELTLAQAARSSPDKPSGPEHGSTSARRVKDETWLQNEMQRIAEQSRELDARERELNKLKVELEGMRARIQETKSERIQMMAKLYDSMDPDAVARQMSNMDDKTVVMILPQMNTRTAAKVMAEIEPKRAAQITTRMLAVEP